MPSDTARPADLLPLRDAARLVDRGLSTLRGWVRAGDLTGWREDPAHPENSPLLVSRAAVLLLVVTAGKAAVPGRRSRAELPESALDTGASAAPAERAERAVIGLRGDLRAALAERDGARATLEATVREVAAVAAQCSTLEALVEAERRRALDLADRLTVAEAERDALRDLAGLPWWRRLLATPAPPRLMGGGGKE